MLKHRNIVVLFVLVFTALVILNKIFIIHWAVYVILLLIFFGIEFYGAYFIHSDFHVKAICESNTSDKVIALTFDDGPVQETENILKMLGEHQATATFFCIGNRIKGKEFLLRKMDEQGHIIGNHSYSHNFLFDLKTTASLLNDIELANAAIKNVIGKSPVFFRPPYGVTTPGIARAVKRTNVEVIGWNIRSLDTSIKDAQIILKRITDRLKPGSIVLLHDTIPGTELVLKELLNYLKKHNYRVVGLDTLIQKKAYA